MVFAMSSSLQERIPAHHLFTTTPYVCTTMPTMSCSQTLQSIPVSQLSHQRLKEATTALAAHDRRSMPIQCTQICGSDHDRTGGCWSGEGDDNNVQPQGTADTREAEDADNQGTVSSPEVLEHPHEARLRVRIFARVTKPAVLHTFLKVMSLCLWSACVCHVQQATLMLNGRCAGISSP